jgi:hypothetical protein
VQVSLETTKKAKKPKFHFQKDTKKEIESKEKLRRVEKF